MGILAVDDGVHTAANLTRAVVEASLEPCRATAFVWRRKYA
jgi:hypothetical protein